MAFRNSGRSKSKDRGNEGAGVMEFFCPLPPKNSLSRIKERPNTATPYSNERVIVYKRDRQQLKQEQQREAVQREAETVTTGRHFVPSSQSHQQQQQQNGQGTTPSSSNMSSTRRPVKQQMPDNAVGEEESAGQQILRENIEQASRELVQRRDSNPLISPPPPPSPLPASHPSSSYLPEDLPRSAENSRRPSIASPTPGAAASNGFDMAGPREQDRFGMGGGMAAERNHHNDYLDLREQAELGAKMQSHAERVQMVVDVNQHVVDFLNEMTALFGAG